MSLLANYETCAKFTYLNEYVNKWQEENIDKLFVVGNTALMFKINNADLDISYWTASPEDKSKARENTGLEEILKIYRGVFEQMKVQ